MNATKNGVTHSKLIKQRNKLYSTIENLEKIPHTTCGYWTAKTMSC